ncbi:triacylglycerol lipase 2 isoform X2 [Hevea brasiliensis]|uniref:triacylglycerol lipase 2 isoform X2 n=1 Tax=Hevea brasiliensis TaxID=3981 RepID=UPI0025D75CB0|nr:triacylglycerol lipase 2 isoform X2 [Hevea brasiliensis]
MTLLQGFYKLWNTRQLEQERKHLKMGNAITLTVILILFCGSAYGKRSMLYSVKGLDVVTALAPSASDGICKTLVEIHGYPCEEHTVTTQDGFILGLQRIPGGAAGGTPGNKTPVLLQHGILMDGAVWVMLPPGQSLAFLLADNGFDVWLANARGTESSSGHTSLRPNDPAFWNWSWDELAGFDLPATFQYVHNQTGQQLHYVAHSLGTLTALSAFSKNQLLDMMRSAALIGPVAYMGQITSPVAKVAADVLTGNASFWLGVAEFDPMGDAGRTLINDVCSTPGVDCSDLLTAFTVIKKGTITMYDYNNEDENKKHYGQPTPPVYDMTHIPNDVPLFLGCGAKDALSDTKDVQLLLDNLKDHVKDKLVVQTIENYAHVDFIFAENVKQIIYDPLIAFVKLH